MAELNPTGSLDPAVAEKRSRLFHETPLQIAERVAVGSAWSLKTYGLRGLLPYWQLLAGGLISPARGLPDPERAGEQERVGIVRDLSVPTLLEAYGRGLFAAGHFGRLAWISPRQRCVLFFDEFHITKRLRRQMRQGRYTVTFDRDFESVIKACAERRGKRLHVTWITPRIMRAYAALYDAGHVHSFEVWNESGALVGGGYGVALGNIFSTESQFSFEDNTSKIGFSMLNWHLARWGYVLNDGKRPTPTILSMGFRNIARGEFRRHLATGKVCGGKIGRWQVETDLATVADWQPQHKREAALQAAE